MIVSRKKLKKKLANFIGCTLQHDGWSCNSCFHSIEEDLNLKEDIHNYWQAVLHIRGDYDDFKEWDIDVTIFPTLLNELYNKLGE